MEGKSGGDKEKSEKQTSKDQKTRHENPETIQSNQL